MKRCMVVVLVLFPCLSVFGQGSLIPPGPPAPVMKTLWQVEPRIPISQVPYTCTVAGASYYLTTNLAAGSGANGILVQAHDITIDLGGWTLSGSGADSGNGIYQSAGYRALSVVNGKVADWRGPGYSALALDGRGNQILNVQAVTNYNGLWAGENARIVGCQAIWNQNMGIRVSAGSLVSDCKADRNLSQGFDVGSGSVVQNCSAYDNGYVGYYVANGATLSDCNAAFNGNHGFDVGDGGNLTGCTAFDNDADGINVANGGTVLRCTAARNVGDGIEGTNSALIQECTAFDNGYSGDGASIHVTGNDGRIENNQATESDRGLDIDGTGNYVAGNTVKDNTDNYSIAAGNQLNLLLCEVPETIDWPAAVTFAGTLTCSALDAIGIAVNASDVTIDLAGHALVGPGDISLDGIYQDFSYVNLKVSNGTIRNWGGGSTAVHTGPDGHLSDLHVSECDRGLWGATRTTFRNCTAVDNGDAGFRADADCILLNCTARRNYSDGFQVSGGVLIKDCTADDNGFSGGDGAAILVAGSNGRIEDNTATGSDRGLDITGTGNYVAGNIVKNNTDNYDIATSNHLNLLLCEIPESLDWPCAVKLAGTLTCSQTGTNGITVSASNVTIDLAGHALVGPGASSGTGIYQNTNQSNLAVSGGTIQGWQGAAQAGVLAGAQASFADLLVKDNETGVSFIRDAAFVRCRATGNPGYGYHSESGGGSFADCHANRNGTGFYAFQRASFLGCTATTNGTGFNVRYKSVLKDCLAAQNTANGFYSLQDMTYIDCTAQANGAAGITMADRSRIQGCRAASNVEEGIRVNGSGSRVDGNHVADNGTGIYANDVGNLIVRNTASDNTTDYDIAAGNADAQVLSPGSAFVSTDPWANFSF